MDSFVLVLVVIITAWVVWFIAKNFTKSGKAKREYKEQQKQLIVEQKAAGTYIASESFKSNSIAYSVMIWAGIGGIATSASDGAVGLIVGAIWGAIIGLISSAIGKMAERKGRSYAAFFWLSVLISPLLMWIIAAAISPLPNSNSTGSPAASSQSNASSQIARDIEELGSLRDRGLITKAEFDSKKKELLDRI